MGGGCRFRTSCALRLVHMRGDGGSGALMVATRVCGSGSDAQQCTERSPIMDEQEAVSEAVARVGNCDCAECAEKVAWFTAGALWGVGK